MNVMRGYLVPFDSYRLPIAKKRPHKKPKTRKPKKTIPAEVVAQVRKNQRALLKKAVRGIGGYDTGRACSVIKSENKRKTWKNTKEYARQIESETGVDFGALDPGSNCLSQNFCQALELKGQKCPDTRAKGGWQKAVRIGIGSKQRRYDKLAERPQYRVLQEALECEGVNLAPEAVTNAQLHQEAVNECRERHSREIDELMARAKKGRLKRPLRKDVPF